MGRGASRLRRGESATVGCAEWSLLRPPAGLGARRRWKQSAWRSLRRRLVAAAHDLRCPLVAAAHYLWRRLAVAAPHWAQAGPRPICFHGCSCSSRRTDRLHQVIVPNDPDNSMNGRSSAREPSRFRLTRPVDTGLHQLANRALLPTMARVTWLSLPIRSETSLVSARSTRAIAP